MSSPSPVFVKKTLPLHLFSLLILIPLTCLSALLSLIHIVQSLISSYNSLVNYLKTRVDPVDLAVFVTAVETELGYITAEKFANLGFTVFAAHKESCCVMRDRLLDLGQNVRPIQCDVIKYKDVTDAADLIYRHCLATGKRLWAVVCIGSFCTENFLHEEGSSIDTFEEIIKINALGSARLAKAFVPLLKSSKGEKGKRRRSRLVFVSNISASMNLPSSICYAMSRAAESQFGYILRKELKKFQILTSFFEPVSFCSARQDSLTPHCPSQPSSPNSSSWPSNSLSPIPPHGPETLFARLRDMLFLSSSDNTTDRVARELVDVVTRLREPPIFISHH